MTISTLSPEVLVHLQPNLLQILIHHLLNSLTSKPIHTHMCTHTHTHVCVCIHTHTHTLTHNVYVTFGHLMMILIVQQ